MNTTGIKRYTAPWSTSKAGRGFDEHAVSHRSIEVEAVRAPRRGDQDAEEGLEVERSRDVSQQERIEREEQAVTPLMPVR